MDLQLEVVRKLISIGASAWALKFERYDIVLSDEVYELANISHFPIIAVPQNVTWYEITKLIVSADGQKKAELSTVYTMTENFLSLTRSLINLSDLPPMIYDYFGYVCAMYNMIDQTQRVCPDDGISTNTILGVLMNYEHSNSPPNGRAVSLSYQNVTYLVKELEVNHVSFGHILIQNHDGEDLFPDGIVEAINFILLSVQFRCSDIFGISKNDAVTRNLFLLNMLQKPISSRDLTTLRALASEYGITLSEQYTIVIVERTSSNAKSDTPANNHIFNRIMQWFTTLNSKSNIIGGWIDFFTFFFLIPHRDISNPALQNIVRTYVGNLQSMLDLNERSVIVGVSPVTQMPELNMGFNRAQRAILVGKKFHLKENILFYGDLELCNMIYETNILRFLRPYYDLHILPLEKYDQENDRDLLRTFDLFLKNNCIIRSTAREMIVHHNTVRYRLQKIQKISGLDLSNRIDLMLAELCLLARPLILSDTGNTLS